MCGSSAPFMEGFPAWDEERDYAFDNGEFKLYVKPLSWNVYVFEK